MHSRVQAWAPKLGDGPAPNTTSNWLPATHLMDSFGTWASGRLPGMSHCLSASYAARCICSEKYHLLHPEAKTQHLHSPMFNYMHVQILSACQACVCWPWFGMRNRETVTFFVWFQHQNLQMCRPDPFLDYHCCSQHSWAEPIPQARSHRISI